MLKPCCFLALLCALATACLHSADAISVTVSAGEFERQDTPAWFTVPEALGDGSFRLKDDTGATIPVQMGAARKACFVLPALKAGQSKMFVLEKVPAVPTTAVAQPAVMAARTGGEVDVSIGGKTVLGYQAALTDLPKGFTPQYQRGGYLYPVYTPSGKLVVDDYPPKHKHHHGIWAPWTKTEFEGRHPDFWNMGDKTGTVEPVGEPAFSGGAVFSMINATHRFMDLSATPPKAALNETWEVIVYTLGASDAKYRVFDWTSTQTCASDSPLKLPKYYYGGLGVRGNRQWDGKEGAFFLTSEGKDRSNGNETRGKWCHMGGKVDGELAGIAILCHPENFRFPQPMRLHPTEQFFCYAPSQLDDWEIAPGKPYVTCYRFVASDGAPDAAQLNRLWQDYATPPVVTVK